MTGLPDPRPHHYSFAHRALPSLAQGEPGRAARALIDDPALALRWWDLAARDLADTDRVDPAGLAVEPHGPWVLVRLPEPVGATECAAVALGPTDVVLTLELAWDVVRRERDLALGSWGPRGHTLVSFGADEAQLVARAEATWPA